MASILIIGFYVKLPRISVLRINTQPVCAECAEQVRHCAKHRPQPVSFNPHAHPEKKVLLLSPNVQMRELRLKVTQKLVNQQR